MSNAGQPTLFGEHLLPEIEDYLKPYADYAEDLDNEMAPSGIPTLAGVALRLNIGKSTLSSWRKLRPVDGDPVLTCENVSQFLQLIDSLEFLQEVYTAHRGLTGGYNPTIAKLVMARHGYADKVDNISSDGSMSPKRDFNDFYQDDE